MGQHPAGDNGIEAQNKARHNQARDAGACTHIAQQGVGGYQTQGAHGIGVSVAANDELSHKCRVGEGESEKEVNQQEGSTAIAGGLGRETPDIAESDSAARGSHNKAKARAELAAGRSHKEESVRASRVVARSVPRWNATSLLREQYLAGSCCSAFGLATAEYFHQKAWHEKHRLGGDIQCRRDR